MNQNESKRNIAREEDRKSFRRFFKSKTGRKTERKTKRKQRKNKHTASVTPSHLVADFAGVVRDDELTLGLERLFVECVARVVSGDFAQKARVRSLGNDQLLVQNAQDADGFLHTHTHTQTNPQDKPRKTKSSSSPTEPPKTKCTCSIMSKTA